MIDFLILYELRAREYENSVYLSVFLEQKGYSVKIASINSLKKKLIRARVIIAPHLYDDEQVAYFSDSFWKNKKKIVSMQYEQVYSVARREERDGYPTGTARKAYHIAWGTSMEKVYKSCGISDDRILRLGSLSLDFDCKQWREQLYTKDDLAKKYGILNEKKWILFMSTFVFYNDGTDYIEKKSEESKMMLPIIVDWLTTLINEKKDYVVIYRKHPSETLDQRVEQAEKVYRGSFIICDDLSIRHWINAADYCCTTDSTAAIDAIYMGKKCVSFAPTLVDPYIETEHVRLTNRIHCYSEFIESLDKTKYDMSLDATVKEFYDNDIDTLVINDYIDALIRVLNSKEIDDTFQREHISKTLSLKRDMSGFLFDLCSLVKLSYVVRMISPKWNMRIKRNEQETYRIKRDKKIYTNKCGSFMRMYLDSKKELR